MKPRATMLIGREMERRCFRAVDLERIEYVAALRHPDVDEPDDVWQVEAIDGAEIAITGWGSRCISDAMLNAAPGLRLVCHSAGSVRSFVDEARFRERGIRVCSARTALAVGVAEFAFGLMLVSMKGLWGIREAIAGGRWDRDEAARWMREPFGATVGIVGASAVGREMIRLCKSLDLAAILVCDPYLSMQDAAALGVEKAELDELMRRSDVVSVHAPDIPATRHLIHARNLALLRDRAVFINTARGACIDEAALIAELEKGRIVACLDVTDPEPPAPDSPLYRLPNCILTPHVAGAVKENTWRQGRLVADQIEAYAAGRPLPGELDYAEFGRMA